MLGGKEVRYSELKKWNESHLQAKSVQEKRKNPSQQKDLGWSECWVIVWGTSPRDPSYKAGKKRKKKKQQKTEWNQTGRVRWDLGPAWCLGSMIIAGLLQLGTFYDSPIYLQNTLWAWHPHFDLVLNQRNSHFQLYLKVTCLITNAVVKSKVARCVCLFQITTSLPPDASSNNKRYILTDQWWHPVSRGWYYSSRTHLRTS